MFRKTLMVRYFCSYKNQMFLKYANNGSSSYHLEKMLLQVTQRSTFCTMGFAALFSTGQIDFITASLQYYTFNKTKFETVNQGLLNSDVFAVQLFRKLQYFFILTAQSYILKWHGQAAKSLLPFSINLLYIVRSAKFLPTTSRTKSGSTREKHNLC